MSKMNRPYGHSQISKPKRRIVITLPDDVTNEDFTKLYYAICAQCEENEEGEPWSEEHIECEAEE